MLRAVRPDDLLPLSERLGYLQAARACLVVAVIATVHASGVGTTPTSVLLGVTLGYLVVSAVPLAVRRLVRPKMLLLLTSSLVLVDGVYLAWVIFDTGGPLSPVRFALFIHVVVMTLLLSYRSGLKIAVWDSLLLAVVAQAYASGMGSPLPGATTSKEILATAITVGALWMIALATASFSALSERELRRQNADLEQLAEMTELVDSMDDPAQIPPALLESLRATFGFTRGVVLASPRGALAVMAASDPPATSEAVHLDPTMEDVWVHKRPLLRKHLDPEVDPTLCALLPDATNILIVPFVLGRQHLGVVAVEHPSNRGGMRRWELSMVSQFASHAALALNNAWLMNELESQLGEIRLLQRELVAQNSHLEIAVADRTQELRSTIRELEEVDLQRRRLLSHVVKVQEDERVRVANDIHDDPLQKLVSVKMRLELLQRTGDVDAHVPPIYEVIHSCIRSLRYLLFDLRPPILDEQGLGPALDRLLAHSDLGATYTLQDELRDDLSEQTRVILYRIAQEALANVRKHAHAHHVTVHLQEHDGGVLLEITDDGVGFAAPTATRDRPGHLGLGAMRERAETAGGRCELHSIPGAGTTLEVWLPRAPGAKDRSLPELAEAPSVPAPRLTA
jgi:signal transduction histidine kinase